MVKKTRRDETTNRTASTEEGEALERRAEIKKIVLTINDDKLAAWMVEKKYNLDKELDTRRDQSKRGGR